MPANATATAMIQEDDELEMTTGGTESPQPGESVEHRGERVPGLTERVRHVWGQALFAVSATEEEVQRVLSRLAGWVEMRPEEARRLAAELTVRLHNEREQLEQSIETAVRSAIRPFRLPSRSELAELDERMSRLESRIDALLARTQGSSDNESS